MYQQMRRKYGMKAEVLGIAPLPAGYTGIKAAQMGGNSWIINPNKPKKVRQPGSSLNFCSTKKALSKLGNLTRNMTF